MTHQITVITNCQVSRNLHWLDWFSLLFVAHRECWLVKHQIMHEPPCGRKTEKTDSTIPNTKALLEFARRTLDVKAYINAVYTPPNAFLQNSAW